MSASGARREPWKRFYDEADLLVVACPLCAADDARVVVQEFGIAIARCRVCGLTYTRIPRSDAQSHYSPDRRAVLGKYERVVAGARPHPRDRNYDEHLATLEGCHARARHARRRQPRRLLPGPRRRARLECDRRRASPVTSALARERFGLDVGTGLLDEVALPEGAFDAVSMTDVFEHVGEPLRVFAHIRRLLRPGGVLFVKVLNVRYVRAKALLLGVPGLLEDCFDAREHLVYYSATTLRRTLEAGGFTIQALTVASPIQAGGRLRRAARALGPTLARRLPRGPELPLATDLAAVARR